MIQSSIIFCAAIIFCDTRTSTEAELFTIFAASWYTSTFTSYRIEELHWSTFALIVACFANTTFFIPPGSTRAFPHNCSYTINYFYDFRDSSANTHASNAVPKSVCWTLLGVAFTRAVNCIPVVGIVQTSLRHTVP